MAVMSQASTGKDPFLLNNRRGIQLHVLLWES